MTDLQKDSSTISWEDDISPRLGKIVSVEGGYTPAKRGVVELGNGQKIFVKISTDENTKKWIKKEIEVYRKLNAAGYNNIPTLLAVNQDNSAMAIEYLENASFENVWNVDKIKAVVEAQESLKGFSHLFLNDDLFKPGSVSDFGIKWPKIIENNNLEIINAKLKKLGVNLSFTINEIAELATLHDKWELKQDTLVHQDIRSDNFGYDPVTKAGKLIDWNWLCWGDAGLDTTPLFINMYLSGINPYELYAEKYDKKMLAYLVSYWLESILEGNEDSSEREFALRVFQAKNTKACIELLQMES